MKKDDFEIKIKYSNLEKICKYYKVPIGVFCLEKFSLKGSREKNLKKLIQKYNKLQKSLLAITEDLRKGGDLWRI